MKIFRMRKKLNLQALTLLQIGRGFKVLGGTLKQPIEKDFPNLKVADEWFKDTFTNRLMDEEAEEWDKVLIDFCSEEEHNDKSV